MNKKIITIAGIVFALIFVVILAIMMGTISNKANTANTKLSSTLEMTDATSLQAYPNGGVVKGEAVVNCINNIDAIGGDVKMKVTVKTLDGAGNNDYGYNTSGNKGTAIKYTQTKTDAPDYINPTASFTITHVNNSNDVMDNIKFEQERK